MGIGFLVIAYAISGVPWKMALKGLKPIIPIVIFTAILNMFFIDGDPFVAVGLYQDYR